MSLLERFTFTKSLAVLSELQELLRCNLCGFSLSGGASSSGRCQHQLCPACLTSWPGGGCPVSKCKAFAHSKDYKPATQTAQAALAVENIQRLLGGGVDSGGGEEEETVVNIEEQVGEFEEKNGPELSDNISPQKALKASAKRKTLGGSKSDKISIDEMEVDMTEKMNNTNEEETGKKDDSGKNLQEKNEQNEGKNKTEQILPPKKSNIHKEKTVELAEDEDFVPQKKTRKLRESSDKIDVTPGPEKPGKCQTRKRGSRSNVGERSGKKTTANARSRERTSSGAKDQSSPVTPANNTLKVSAKGPNTPVGFGLPVTPSSLLSRGTPTTPATLEKKNKKGETALQTAVIKGEETTVRQLLEAGACPNTRDNAGWTPLHEARGRPEMVEMLLEAGALPSVPAGDDRMTALHEAASAGQVEVVRLLVRHGADRKARDRMGRTPSQLAQSHAEVLIVLKNEPHVPPPSGVRLQGPPRVVLMKEDPSKLAVKLGCQEMREVGEATTHMVASQDQADQVQWLAAVIVGAEIVGESWLKEGEVGEEEGHRLEAEGLEISRVWRAGLQPKLLAGIHIYFKGIFSSPSKVELQMLARLGGATVLNREPDPECIPPKEAGVPHHAKPLSSLAKTNHIIIYDREGRKSGRKEDMVYNMAHLKTLPTTWFIASLKAQSLLDPAPFVL